jgi:hypothetical protein
MAGLPPVNIQFIAGGVPNVLSAIKTLEQAFTQLETKITNATKKGAEDRVNAYKKEFDSKKSMAEKFSSEYAAILQREVSSLSSHLQKKETLERQHTQNLRNEAAKRGQIFQAALQSMGIQGVTANSHIGGQMQPGIGGVGSTALLAGGAAFFGQSAMGMSSNGLQINGKTPEQNARDRNSIENKVFRGERLSTGLIGEQNEAQRYKDIRRAKWGMFAETIPGLSTLKSGWGAAGHLLGREIDSSLIGTGKQILGNAALGAGGHLVDSYNKSHLMTAGLAAVAGSLYMMKRALDVVTGGFTAAAHELAGGVTQIGGGFGIGSSLVKAASLETQAYQISYNAASAKDRMPVSEIMSWSKAGSKSGEHSQEQYLAGLRSYQALTGRTSEFKNMSGFIGKLSSVSGASFEDLAKSAAQTRLQFSEFTPNQMQDLLLKQWQAGKEGAIEIKDAGAMARVTAGARMLAGGPTVENFMKQIGGVQIARRVAASPEEAVTAYERFQDFSARNSGQLEALGAHKVLNKDNKFRDMAQTIVDSAHIIGKINPGQAEKLFGREGIRMARGAAAVIGEGKSNEQALALVNEILNTKSSLKDLDEAFKEIQNTTQYQLKQAFNELTEEVGTGLMSVLKENMPQIKGLLKDLIASIPNLMTEFLAMGQMLPLVGDSFKALVPVTMEFAKALLQMAGWLTDIPEKRRDEMNAEFQGVIARLEEQRQNANRSPEQIIGQRAQDVVAIKDIIKSEQLNLSSNQESDILKGGPSAARTAGWLLANRPDIKGTNIEADLKRVLSLESGNQALIDAAGELNNAANAITLAANLKADPNWQGPIAPKYGPAGSGR